MPAIQPISHKVSVVGIKAIRLIHFYNIEPSTPRIVCLASNLNLTQLKP
jgi:hypothetical protein